VATADRHDPPPHSPRKGDDLLYLGDALRAEVELRARVEGARPCVVDVGLRGAEWDVGIEPVKLNQKLGRHAEGREG